MVKTTDKGFFALWNKKYPYQKANYLEMSKTLYELISKLEKRDDIDN